MRYFLLIFLTACAQTICVQDNTHIPQEGMYNGLLYNVSDDITVWEESTVTVHGSTVEFGLYDNKCRIRVQPDATGRFNYGEFSASHKDIDIQCTNDFIATAVSGQFYNKNYSIAVVGFDTTGEVNIMSMLTIVTE